MGTICTRTDCPHEAFGYLGETGRTRQRGNTETTCRNTETTEVQQLKLLVKSYEQIRTEVKNTHYIKIQFPPKSGSRDHGDTTHAHRTH